MLHYHVHIQNEAPGQYDSGSMYLYGSVHRPNKTPQLTQNTEINVRAMLLIKTGHIMYRQTFEGQLRTVTVTRIVEHNRWIS